jgi:hypothetical protein
MLNSHGTTELHSQLTHVRFVPFPHYHTEVTPQYLLLSLGLLLVSLTQGLGWET